METHLVTALPYRKVPIRVNLLKMIQHRVQDNVPIRTDTASSCERHPKRLENIREVMEDFFMVKETIGGKLENWYS